MPKEPYTYDVYYKMRHYIKDAERSIQATGFVQRGDKIVFSNHSKPGCGEIVILSNAIDRIEWFCERKKVMRCFKDGVRSDLEQGK